MIKNSLISEVSVLWMACINSKTKEKMYTIPRIIEFFSVMALVIISMESPIIKHTKVVMLFDIDEKKDTLGNKQMPSKA